jgi:hypothetical protein
MPAILRDLPFSVQPSTLVAGDDVVVVRPYQIVLWVSVVSHRFQELPPNAVRLPAILDTGLSHNFSIQSSQLQSWSRIPSDSLRVLRRARINRVDVPLYGADLWIHPNRPGERDRFTDARPFRLTLAQGIAVYPADTPGEPRLPLLGLRALVKNNLHLTIDGKNRRVGLRTARRFWLF